VLGVCVTLVSAQGTDSGYLDADPPGTFPARRAWSSTTASRYALLDPRKRGHRHSSEAVSAHATAHPSTRQLPFVPRLLLGLCAFQT
jgi:hypothetical protein